MEQRNEQRQHKCSTRPRRAAPHVRHAAWVKIYVLLLPARFVLLLDYLRPLEVRARVRFGSISGKVSKQERAKEPGQARSGPVQSGPVPYLPYLVVRGDRDGSRAALELELPQHLLVALLGRRRRLGELHVRVVVAARLADAARARTHAGTQHTRAMLTGEERCGFGCAGEQNGKAKRTANASRTRDSGDAITYLSPNCLPVARAASTGGGAPFP